MGGGVIRVVQPYCEACGRAKLKRGLHRFAHLVEWTVQKVVSIPRLNTEELLVAVVVDVRLQHNIARPRRDVNWLGVDHGPRPILRDLADPWWRCPASPIPHAP